MSTSHNESVALGQAGETRASVYLQEKGYQILGLDVRYGQNELDIVAYDPEHQETVFVEVKTRQTDFSGDPAEAVDARKLSAFIKAGLTYAHRQHLQTDFRFDVIAITPESIEHFENVTFP